MNENDEKRTPHVPKGPDGIARLIPDNTRRVKNGSNLPTFQNPPPPPPPPPTDKAK